MSQKYQNLLNYQSSILSDAKLRKELFLSLCEHLSQGLSIQCFSKVAPRFLKEVMTKFPEDFPQDVIELAITDGQDWWENLGKDQSNGKNPGNSRTWYYNMSNRYGWCDKVDLKAKHEGSLNVSIVNYSKPSSS